MLSKFASTRAEPWQILPNCRAKVLGQGMLRMARACVPGRIIAA
jgi:hypothetical protein